MSAIGLEYHKSGMLSKEQLLRLFDRFAFLSSQSGQCSLLSLSLCFSSFYLSINGCSISLGWCADVKQRIADAVKDKQVRFTFCIYEYVLLSGLVHESVWELLFKACIVSVYGEVSVTASGNGRLRNDLLVFGLQLLLEVKDGWKLFDFVPLWTGLSSLCSLDQRFARLLCQICALKLWLENRRALEGMEIRCTMESIFDHSRHAWQLELIIWQNCYLLC